MSDTAARVDRVAPKWETDAKEAIKAALRRYQKPLADLVARDANEGDTRLLVTDFLCDALGYDKYEDLTTEFAVRGEFADYGVRIDKQLIAFIEVKRAAQGLSAKHLRQVETYAVKEGLEWMILTNGRTWQAYHVEAHTGQQVATNLVFSVDLLGEDPPAKKAAALFHLHRGALKRGTIGDLWKQKAATAPSALAQVLQTSLVIDAIRKEIRQRSKFNPEAADIKAILRAGVIKSELLLP
jgi:predicted type IV restriction endonuclease